MLLENQVCLEKKSTNTFSLFILQNKHIEPNGISSKKFSKTNLHFNY